MSRRRTLPVEPFQAVINSLNPNGTGLAEHEGRRLQVFGALPREEITARYLYGRKFKDQAGVLEVLRPSAERVEPACPYFGTCGGCALQHLDYTSQLQFKQGLMLAMLEEAGGVSPARILPALTAGPWQYRRKARMSVRDVPRKGRVLVGFREQDGRFVVDMLECHTLDTRIAGQLSGLSALLDSMHARREIPQIEACCGDRDCAFIFRHLEDLDQHDLDALRVFEANSGIQVWLQPGGPDSVCSLGPDPVPLRYELASEGIEFQFEPLDFVQVNAGLNQLMIQQAMDLLEVESQHTVLDLFCGLGNFSLPLARRAGQVVGLEGDPGLVERAAANAERNGISNVRFQAANLYADNAGDHLGAARFDSVLLDPPRSGAAGVLTAMAASGADRVLYVSCNPATLAADAGQLVRDHGYELLAAGIMDMFPQTAHIESMALFKRAPARRSEP